VLDANKSGAVLDFFTNLPNFIEAGMSGFQDLLDGVVEALPAILEQIPVIITKIAEIFSNKETINKMIQSAIQIVAAIVQALPTIIQALVAAIPNIITTLVSAIIENIPMFLKLGIVIGLAIIDGLVNIIISGINWLIDQLNKIPFVNIGHVPLLNLSGQFAQVAFAEGGFPMQGRSSLLVKLVPSLW
jgi:phage-related protein